MFSNVNRISGLSGSGFDTEGTIEKIMQAERAKYDKLFQKRQALVWKKEDYREINTALAKMRDSARNMKLQGTFMAKKVSTADESKLTATAGANASDGIVGLAIKQLAEGANKISQAKITVEGGSATSLSSQFGISGPISFEINGCKFEYSDPSAVSIYDVVSDINKATVPDPNNPSKQISLGVKANYDAGTDLFFLTTTSTGKNQKIELKDTNGSFLQNSLRLMNSNTDVVEGKDAIVYLKGMDPSGPGISQSANSFTINGITYNLKATTVAGPIVADNEYINVNVTTDVDTVFNNIKTFMDDYNTIIDTLYNKINEDKYRTYLPLTDQQREAMSEDDIKKWEEKARSGLLRNDSILSSALNKIRSNMTSSVLGVATESQLTNIGIETGKYYEHGKLKFSDDTGEKLKEAIRQNPDAIINLFTKDGETEAEKGIGRRIFDTIETVIKDVNKVAGFSVSTNDDSILGKQIVDLDGKLKDENTRLIRKENNYWTKFTAMEKALSQMMNQSSWLSQQLGGGQ